MLLLLFALCMLAGVKSQVDVPAGAGDVEFSIMFTSSAEVCDDDSSKSFVDTSQVEVFMANETCVMMRGLIEFKKMFNNLTMIEIVLQKENNRRYDTMMTHEIKNACGEIRDPESQYTSYIKPFGFPEDCPFATGMYKIKDLLVPTDDIPADPTTVGAYQSIMNIFNCGDETCNEKTFLCCMKISFVIETV